MHQRSATTGTVGAGTAGIGGLRAAAPIVSALSPAGASDGDADANGSSSADGAAEDDDAASSVPTLAPTCVSASYGCAASQ